MSGERLGTLQQAEAWAVARHDATLEREATDLWDRDDGWWFMPERSAWYNGWR
jgi:hypothetical protein